MKDTLKIMATTVGIVGALTLVGVLSQIVIEENYKETQCVCEEE